MLTSVPSNLQRPETARRLAADLGLPVLLPEVGGLVTFDKSHLVDESAERYSAAFLAALEPFVRACRAAG